MRGCEAAGHSDAKEHATLRPANSLHSENIRGYVMHSKHQHRSVRSSVEQGRQQFWNGSGLATKRTDFKCLHELINAESQGPHQFLVNCNCLVLATATYRGGSQPTVVIAGIEIRSNIHPPRRSIAVKVSNRDHLALFCFPYSETRCHRCWDHY